MPKVIGDAIRRKFVCRILNRAETVARDLFVARGFLAFHDVWLSFGKVGIVVILVNREDDF